MKEVVPFGGHDYFLLLGVILFGRGMDFLSTRVATPNLVLEGNPVAKWLGWRWGIPLNIAVCFSCSVWPQLAISLATMSVLIAARNFQQAWLMRSFGEENYRDWHIARIQEAPPLLYLSCLFGETALPAAVGGTLFYCCYPGYIVPMAIGLGIVLYAVAVAFYTLLAVWRLRRSMG